jgi:hypothetical protein
MVAGFNKTAVELVNECSYIRKNLKLKKRKLNLEVVVSPETMVCFYQNARRHIPEESVRGYVTM